MAKKTIYYTDALHDDFANAQIDRKPVSPDFPLVINNIFWKIAEKMMQIHNDNQTSLNRYLTTNDKKYKIHKNIS